MYEDVAFGNKEGVVLLNLQFAYSLLGLMGKNIRYQGLLNVVLAPRHERYTDTVAVQGEHGVTLRYKNWLSTVIGLE